MDVRIRIEKALEAVIERVEVPESPPKLAAAVRYAVLPGGARIRPRICLAVARACGDDEPSLADAAAVSIELIHCASLVHDDMPCFDDADTRRGKASVHAAFGENVALLAGDALIVQAFETLGRAATLNQSRIIGLVRNLAQSTGAPSGIISGQAWECEPQIALAHYHRAKTGALFAAASAAGAIAAGVSAEPWRIVGAKIGEAYQVADDIQDIVADPAAWGKPCGQDEAHGRPNALRELGPDAAVQRLKDLLTSAIESIPSCDGADTLRAMILAEAKRFMPKGISQVAA